MNRFEKDKQVKVLHKNQFNVLDKDELNAGKNRVKNVLGFEFPDGSLEGMEVPYKVFETTVINDTGIWFIPNRKTCGNS